jgi:hypothetical protein
MTIALSVRVRTPKWGETCEVIAENLVGPLLKEESRQPITLKLSFNRRLLTASQSDQHGLGWARSTIERYREKTH